MRKNIVMKMYRLLEDYFGDLKWWPADTDFEVIVGAILTQNTAWTNVEKAINALREEGLIDPSKIKSINVNKLSRLIRPSGYHRQKSIRLKDISKFLMKECGGDLKKLRHQDKDVLRKKFLQVKGVGPETADSIMLYALGKKDFVVDTYTRRIFSRHKMIQEGASYDEIKNLVHKGFPMKLKDFNQFHALLVETGKHFCKKKEALCNGCPLECIL